MTTPLGPTTGTTSLDNKIGSALGKDDFLRILVTQLQNQDPLSPMDGAQFAAQLAQFSTVEQLVQIGSKLDAQQASAAANTLSTQTMLGTSLIGHDVMLRGTSITSNGSDPSRIAVELGDQAKKVSVEVLGKDGTILDSQTFSGLSAGRHVLTLDDIDVPAGEYQFKVSAVDDKDAAITATGYNVGRVDGVSFSGGEVVLRIDGSLVPMLDILEVLSAGPTAAGSTTTEGTTLP